jgi:predicted outer membrane protein
MSYRRTMFAIAAFAAGACSHSSHYGIAGGTLAPELTSSGLSTADVAGFTAMSSDQRMTHMIVGDSMEAAIAYVATWRSVNRGIQAYAQNLVADQKRALERAGMIVHQQGFVLDPAPADTMPAHLWQMLDTFNSRTPGTEFDRAFIMSQIDLHSRMLAEFESMQTIVGNPAAEVYVKAAIPMVQGHLRSAQHIARDLGYIDTP